MRYLRQISAARPAPIVKVWCTDFGVEQLSLERWWAASTVDIPQKNRPGPPSVSPGARGLRGPSYRPREEPARRPEKMTVMSMVLPVITAAAMGAGFARLTFLMFDLFEDENGGTMDARIAALDTLMRRMVKPKTIVTSADGDDATGVYRAAAWPAISVKDLFYAEVDKNCGPACVTHPEDQDEGPVKFVRESQFTKRLMTDEGAVEGDGDTAAAPERPSCDHGGEDGSCYICFERDMNSILLPCGHSGVCYQCAIEKRHFGSRCWVWRLPLSCILFLGCHGRVMRKAAVRAAAAHHRVQQHRGFLHGTRAACRRWRPP